MTPPIARPGPFTPLPRLRAETAYARALAPQPIDLRLDANEGSPRTPEEAAALLSLAPDVARRYPDARALESLLAERLGVAPERVLLTAGADDALDRACRVALEPGRTALATTPTFEMIPRAVRLAGAALLETAWLRGPFPTTALINTIDERTGAIFVVTPNNPTGAVATGADLRALSDAAPHALLVVDLAYTEYADDDLTQPALELPNAVVLRTLSKAWGLAGLRVGYAVAAPGVVRALRAAGPPYAVSAPSSTAASVALERDAARTRAGVERVRTEREVLARLLSTLGAEPEASQGNFVLARFDNPARVRALLAGLGVGVRAFAGPEPLRDALRITCPGDGADFDRLTHALRTALAPQAILLDMDGVIADVSRSYREAIIRTAASYGVRCTRDDVARAKARGDANNDWALTQRLLRDRGVEATLEDVTARFEAMYQGSEREPGMRETETLIPLRATLDALRAAHPLAIVTGRPRRDARRFLDRFGLADFFETIVCLEDAPSKPDPAPVRRALESLGVDRAWLVGDTVDDVRAARAAGVIPIGVPAPGEDAAASTDTLLRAGAALVIDTLDQLPETLP